MDAKTLLERKQLNSFAKLAHSQKLILLQKQLHCKVLQWFNRQLLLLCAELELWLLLPSPVIRKLGKMLASAPIQITIKPGAKKCEHNTNVLGGGVSWLWFYTHLLCPPAPCRDSLFESCRIKVAMGSLSVYTSAELQAFFCVWLHSNCLQGCVLTPCVSLELKVLFGNPGVLQWASGCRLSAASRNNCGRAVLHFPSPPTIQSCCPK